MGEFTEKVVLITGGSSGIGKATALAFAQKGAKVAIGSRRTTESSEIVDKIQANGGEAIFIQTDIKKAADVENLVNQTVNTFGRLDFAFNNAGIEGMIAPGAEQTEESWDNVIDTNLKGVWLSMKYEILQMLAQGGGIIVNNSSAGGVVAAANISSYIASKHGVIGLTKAFALEYAQSNIRVNAVCPACIETGMVHRAFSDQETLNKMIAMHPIGRMGTPEEVANAVIWLCSDNSSFMTGHSLMLDGGLTAQ
jgi:NAD(P)-dependent dehydrogenase (short-subunit alcohol dehydrogenase family)